VNITEASLQDLPVYYFYACAAIIVNIHYSHLVPSVTFVWHRMAFYVLVCH